MEPAARIGFHAAYVEEDGEAREDGPGNAIVGSYLTHLKLPLEAIVYITSART